MGELLAGRFELIEPIGEGATGTVWVCFDHHSARVLAAKVLRQSYSASVLRFAREQSHRIRGDHVLTPVG